MKEEKEGKEGELVVGEKLLIKKAKKTSIKEGSAYSLMDGFGLKYITPFALYLGASNQIIGLLSSIPNLLGTISQLYANKLMETKKRKKIVFLGVFLQALMWLPLLGIGLSYYFFNLPSLGAAIALVVVYSLLIAFGSFVGPAWNSWMKDIVTERSGEYFGLRNRIAGSIALVAMLVAGVVLDYFKKTNIVIGFSILFLVAFIGRSLSAYLVKKTHEPKIEYERGYYFSFFDFVKKMHHNNFGRFVIYATLMTLVQYIAAPFFSVYMLTTLKLNYTMFTLVTIGSLIASLTVMPLWGKFADKYGNLKTVNICSALVPLEPVLWMLSPMILNFGFGILIVYLVFISAFMGVVWAGFNLSESNFMYDAVSRQRIALCFSYFNIINAGGIFIGATLGGWLASSHISILGLTPILIVFGISAIGRLLIHIFFSPRIKEVRETEKFNFRDIRSKIKSLSAKELWSYLGIKSFDV